MIHFSKLLAAVAGGALLPLVLAAQEGKGTSCPRDPARAVTEKGVVRNVTGDPPCRLVFRKTGVRLTATPDGSWPDPGPTVVKDGHGRYYSANADGWLSTISVWSADGAYLASFGSSGEGPGEFRGWYLSLFVDPADSLHVHDAANWTVFSPAQEFVRQAPSGWMGSGGPLRMEETIVLLYDGRILASNGHPSSGDAYFRMVNGDGTLEYTFGTAEDGTGASGDYGHDRAIAYNRGHAGFWAAPSIEGASGYVLEHWSIESQTPDIVQSLRRRQPWFRWTGDSITSSWVGELHITADGLLYVVVVRPSEEYVEAMKRYEHLKEEGGGGRWTPEIQEEIEALDETLVHFVVEVIDTRSATLLASDAYLLGDIMRGNPVLPQGLFRNEMTGYVYGVGEDGLPYVDIVEGVLERK
ncbi:MAG: hypothetical protein F4107_00440 [Gemmatimonadetes bacterium]|nr:hypothetical protein [Gemmatimonadota bacterium]MXX33138.1 hypothetical protein [Gemmatimonadota bacterium]MYD15259.1 hypothetical protein [Gemmatimonadota bacterium]MYI64395.1 hypothetical protein [Gemmatimonadota bacterium]